MTMTSGVFVGMAGLDLVYMQDLVPAENQKSKTNHYATHVGGPAANAAITYALLGGSATLVTCVGDSFIGQMVKNSIAMDYGVRVLDCATGQEVLPCISSISVNIANGSRTIWSGQQVYDAQVSPEASEAVESAGFCLFDGGLAEISKALLLMANENARDIVLDMGSWKPDSGFFLSLASEVIASAACIPPPAYGSFIEAAQKLGLSRIAVTNGEHPIQWREDDQAGEITPPLTEAKDTLGAGDVYHGAYCYYRYHEGLPFVEALAGAADVAARSVAYYGPREGVGGQA